jgi:hypothetical protein
VLVKIADLLDNLPYMMNKALAGDLRDFLRDKIKRYIELVKPVMGNEPLFRELEEQYEILSAKS